QEHALDEPESRCAAAAGAVNERGFVAWLDDRFQKLIDRRGVWRRGGERYVNEVEPSGFCRRGLAVDVGPRLGRELQVEDRLESHLFQLRHGGGLDDAAAGNRGFEPREVGHAWD